MQASFALSVDHFALGQGESTLLLGESGSGKSTLLSLICGTITPASGHITIAGTDITGLGAAGRDRFRAETIGVIFQQFNLLPFASVLDNILLPLQFAPERRKRAVPEKPGAEKLCSSGIAGQCHRYTRSASECRSATACGSSPCVDRCTSPDHRR